MGMTMPTTDLEQPRRSIFSIIRGRADSEEEVPSTMRISSRMKRRNLNMFRPVHSSTAPRMTTTNRAW